MLDDEPPFCVHINISLSNVEDAPIVIPSDTRLDGELDIVFLLFSCLRLRVKPVSECISPEWSKPEEYPSNRSDDMCSSNNALRLLVALPWGLCSTSSHSCPT